MKTVEVEISRSVDASAAVAWWNYWDHEHIDVVHGGYKRSDILYERDNYLFRIDSIRIPIFSFIPINTVIFQVQHSEDTMYCYCVQFGVLSLSSFRIRETAKDRCELTMNYKFFLSGWSVILEPFLKWMIPIWNAKVWDEDMPLKLRRQKVLRMNFKDFTGLPKELERRVNDEPLQIRRPVPRPKNSTRDRHVGRNGGTGFISP